MVDANLHFARDFTAGSDRIEAATSGCTHTRLRVKGCCMYTRTAHTFKPERSPVKVSRAFVQRMQQRVAALFHSWQRFRAELKVKGVHSIVRCGWKTGMGWKSTSKEVHKCAHYTQKCTQQQQQEEKMQNCICGVRCNKRAAQRLISPYTRLRYH